MRSFFAPPSRPPRRRDGIVDCEAGVVFRILGIALGDFRVNRALLLGEATNVSCPSFCAAVTAVSR
jgi:hypothetical protein